jgi:DNA-binding HxlR family transcriptional regulator
VTAKNIANVLNNESNLRILEKLKERPFYPRELAAEMKLSEPFIVRRLKSMEEYNIVEGRWENEGSRKVKRYYLKDVTLQLGKSGLKVSSAEMPKKQGVNFKNDMIARLLKLPLVLLFIIGVFFDVPALIAVLCLVLAWYALSYYSFYEELKYKTLLLSSVISAIGSGLLFAILARDEMVVSTPKNSMWGITAIFVIVILALALFQARYYQAEIDRMVEDERKFIKGLDKSSFFLKIVYMPIVIRWHLCEYLGLV